MVLDIKSGFYIGQHHIVRNTTAFVKLMSILPFSMLNVPFKVSVAVDFTYIIRRDIILAASHCSVTLRESKFSVATKTFLKMH